MRPRRYQAQRYLREQLLLERELDLGIVTTPPRHEQLLSKVLFREEIVLVAAPDWQARARPRAVELDELSLIAFPVTTGFRAYLDSVAAGGIARRARRARPSSA